MCMLLISSCKMGPGDKEGSCVSGVRLEPPQFQWALFKGSDLSAIWGLRRKSLLASALDTLSLSVCCQRVVLWKIRKAGQSVGWLEHSYTAGGGGRVKWYNHFVNLSGSLC